MTHDYRMINDYRDNREYRQSFNRLANETFGIDFEEWYRQGHWGDRYICHSFIDGDRVVANVSASKLEVIIDGASIRVINIGTVMTHPDYRGQGLSAELMRTVIEAYENECEWMYLFANSTVLDFYPRFGFMPVRESRYSVDIRKDTRRAVPFRKLHTELPEDRRLLGELAYRRMPLSRKFGVKHAGGILAWHIINLYPGDLYYLEEERTAVICRTEADTLHVYDVISDRRDYLQPVLDALAGDGVKRAELHFTPDFPDAEARCEFPGTDSGLFVKMDPLTLPLHFKYPATAQA